MEIISNNTKFLLALSQLKGIGPATLKNIAVNTNNANLTIDFLFNHDKKIKKALENSNAWDESLEFVEEQIDYAKEYNVKIISILDECYPALLQKSKHDPSLLFIKGALHTYPENTVGIIGTREPTPHGKIITERVAQFFIENNWSIVSGLAIGCDSIAHQAAVNNKSHTVAVLAHGLETIAPKQNKKLAEDILENGGMLVSQFPFKSDIRPINFVVRDKVQAGLSQGIIMIQSDINGGSLHASRAILSDNRWLSVPNPTQLDRDNKESKIGANLTIIDGETIEVEKLLECKPSDLKNIHKLYSKDDYSKLLLINRNEQFSLI
ncbi:DNA-processing protein DprA [Gallibacterium anatis]|uniref:DNA-processing protein DprA n=1 Tax=Gallibacterium anatis TaxID=750 RepID=UPI00053188A3|nr:DNA-processing protein DprA [Gallibacterium anatis]KGQ29354.1 hypothetical protein JP27_01215 [Gallibacterium anatis]